MPAKPEKKMWALDDLIKPVAKPFMIYWVSILGKSPHTMQANMEMMCSNKLGYEAPIVAVDKKHTLLR